MLRAGGLPWFESVVNSFSTAGTGGFATKIDGMVSYTPYSQNVISVFLILFGINFNLYYLILIGKLRAVFKSTELWAYLGIAAASVAVIAANIFSIYQNVADSLRYSFFQVASIMTTAGFASANFDLWPGLSKGILLLLMCIGACAGSTAGGIKVSRVVIFYKLIVREFRRMLHPRSVSAVKFEGKAVDDQVLNSVATYFAIYMLCGAVAFLAISFEPFGFETNFSAVIATFNNIGPGFSAVGPMGGYGDYSIFSKLVFSFLMLLGRLEIFPLIIALSPSTWKKSR